MALEPEIGLVGRDDVAALLESLVDRRKRHPLPIVVAFGPGGSGKTSLLDHARRRYGEAPVAKVDLDKAGSKTCKDILDVVVEQLRSYSHEQFGRMRLPRYALARLALAAEPTEEPHRRARELAAQQMTRLVAMADATTATAEALPPAQGWARVVRPLLRWLISLAVVAAPPLRWLIAGPRVAGALRWFEKHVSAHLMDGRRTKFDAALVHTWKVHQEPDDQVEIDRLLVAALLADVRAAYRFRRHRRMNCVLLLDGADLLDGVDSYLPPRRPRPQARNTDFLSLLAQERKTQPHVPLLVVATKQASPDLPVEEIDYAAWRQRFEQTKDVFLPVRLKPFELEHTRQFLAEWNRKRDSTVESEALVEEIHEVTHGHPLAVRLAIQLVQFVYSRDQVVPSVRAVFDERLPVDETTTFQDATVSDYLLLRFFQRIPGADEVPERETAREVFARLAAPRTLDLHTVRALVPSAWSAENMRTLLGELSFVERDGDGFVLHPLLRDLLAKRLREVPAGSEFSHAAVHRLLKARYDQLGRPQEALYHALALGEIHLVANRLRPHVDAGSHRWVTDLTAIAQAPMPPSHDVAATPPKWRDIVQKIVHSRFDRLVSPETGKLEVAIFATWQLLSSTSFFRRTPEMYDKVLQSYQALNTGGAAVEERLVAYRRLKRALEDNTPASQPPALPRYTKGKHTFPRVWPGRHGLRRAAVYAVVLLLVAYGVTFYSWTRGHCVRYGVMEPWELAAELADSTLALSKQDNVECVGISAKPGRFAYGDPALQNSDDAEVEAISRLIAEENRKVLAVKDRSHVTIVVATMLSSRDNLKRDLSAGVNELRGAYLAQRDWNQLEKTRPDPLVRLVLANFGGESKHAPATAKQICDLAQRDPTVIAVTGMGQSRAATVTAAGLMAPGEECGPGIPMVASAPSSNDFTNKPYFFRAAPSNTRQAEVAAKIITGQERLRDRPVYLISNPGDEYSKDLANSYRTLGPAEFEYDDGSPAVSKELSDIVGQICRESDRALILYTGRANEVSALLTELSRRNCGDPVVFGGDDLSQLETSNYADLEGIKQFASDRLYFTTFGWTPGTQKPIPQPTQQFFANYRAAQDRHGSVAYRSGPNGHIMLAYDAVNLAARAAGVRPTPESVFQALRAMTDFDGASGRISFARPDVADDKLGSDPVNKLVVGQFVKLENGKLTSRYLLHDGA